MLTMTICAHFLLCWAAASPCSAATKPRIDSDHEVPRVLVSELSVVVNMAGADLSSGAGGRPRAAIARFRRETRHLSKLGACGHAVIVAGNHLTIWVVLRSRGPDIEEVLTL